MRPIQPCSLILVNHRAPSGPAVMPNGYLVLGVANEVIAPAVVMRPIEPRRGLLLVNHRAPSGPAVISSGLMMLGCVKMVTAPAVVIRPIESQYEMVNQRAPSGPVVIP